MVWRRHKPPTDRGSSDSGARVHWKHDIAESRKLAEIAIPRRVFPLASVSFGCIFVCVSIPVRSGVSERTVRQNETR